MLMGQQTWMFNNKPVIISTGTVGGPFEAKGPLANDFDILFDDIWMGEDSFEKAEKVLYEEAFNQALQKVNLKKENIQFLFAGDLVNQLTPSNFAARTMAIPFFGLFGACSTSMEGLALASYIINTGGADYILTGSASHKAAIEKQFRYPNEYGAQKPPTAQWTATAAGAAIVAKSGSGPSVTSATIGKVIDMGLSDPYNLGGAMAPAAVDTIETHLKDRNISSSYYDLIITGDLGKTGHKIAQKLFTQKNINIGKEQFKDCGILIYNEDQNVQAGASGSGCSAAVTYGHLMNEMKAGKIKKMLVVATGALLSPLSYQQKESIPCIAHAVSIEMNQ